MSDKGLNWTILGVGKTAKNCVVAYHDPKHKWYTVLFCDIDNPDGSIKRGDRDFPLESINGIYHTLYICKKESLKALIDTLQQGYDTWED